MDVDTGNSLGVDLGMRDIREDLRERLHKIESERAEIQSQLDQLSTREASLRTLLQEENIRWANQRDLFNPPHEHALTNGHRTVLAQFIMRALADGTPRDLDVIKQMAQEQHIDFEDKNPGRVLHFALLGMAQSGTVEMIEKGVWKLK